VAAALGPGWAVVATPLESQVGSGAQPGERLPSFGLAVRRAPGARRQRVERLARTLRTLPRPVIGRVADEVLWLDLRCLAEPDEALLLGELAHLPA